MCVHGCLKMPCGSLQRGLWSQEVEGRLNAGASHVVTVLLQPTPAQPLANHAATQSCLARLCRHSQWWGKEVSCILRDLLA